MLHLRTFKRCLPEMRWINVISPDLNMSVAVWSSRVAEEWLSELQGLPTGTGSPGSPPLVCVDEHVCLLSQLFRLQGTVCCLMAVVSPTERSSVDSLVTVELRQANIFPSHIPPAFDRISHSINMHHLA